MKSTASQTDLSCPSAQPDMAGAKVLGIVEDREGLPEISYLDTPRDVDQEILDLAKPLSPTEVFRFAGKCVTSKCQHFNGDTCSLASRISKLTEEVVTSAPKCVIRKSCRWFQQEGLQICYRCPQVTTNFDPRDKTLGEIAGLTKPKGLASTD